MTGEGIEKRAGYVAMSAEVAADAAHLRQAIGDMFRPLSPEERAQRIEATRARRAEREAAAVAAEREHADRVAGASGLRRAVLELHGPQRVSYTLAELSCNGCEYGGHDGEPVEFPCSTYTLARDWND